MCPQLWSDVGSSLQTCREGDAREVRRNGRVEGGVDLHTYGRDGTRNLHEILAHCALHRQAQIIYAGGRGRTGAN